MPSMRMLPALGCSTPEHHVDGRGLARAVGAEQTHDLAGADAEGDAVDGDRGAVAFGETLDLQRVLYSRTGRAGLNHAAVSADRTCRGARRSGIGQQMLIGEVRMGHVLCQSGGAPCPPFGYSRVMAKIRRGAHEDLAGALRYQSEERFRLLVESVKDYAIFMLDLEGHVVSWNAGAEHITGYRADEVIGEPCAMFYPPEARETHRPEHELDDCRQPGSSSRVKAGGSVRAVSASGHT